MRTIRHWSVRVLFAFLFALACVALPASSSFAQSSEERAEKVEQLSAEATEAYRAGEFQKAADLFEEAYGIEPVPNLLFNIARSYEKMENWDQAIDYYEKFVVEEGISKKARKSALGRLSELKDMRARENAESKDEDKIADSDKSVEDPEETEEPDAGSNTAAWVAVGTGVALVAGGGVFGLVASGKQSDFEDATSRDAKVDARDSGQTMALIADVMYISGAVVTGIGIYLLLSGDSESDTRQATAFPWVSGDSAGVSIRTPF